MTGRSDLDRAGLGARLERRRAELERQAAGESGKTGIVVLDQQAVGRLSRMDAMQGQEMALAQARRRTAEMKRIDGALARLDSENYGYCVKCDEEIALKRIELDPTLQTCIDCAE